MKIHLERTRMGLITDWLGSLTMAANPHYIVKTSQGQG